MKILAFNTSEKVLSLGICEEDKLIYELTSNHSLTHGEQLMPEIVRAFDASPFSLEDIDRIAVAKGPGSYTGLRIAVTTAKTLAWTANIEVVGVSSLAVLAKNACLQSDYIVPLMDARRGNIYTGLYQYQQGRLKRIEKDRQIDAGEWAHTLKEKLGPSAQLSLVGHDLTDFQDQFKDCFTQLECIDSYLAQPSAYHLAQLGRLMSPVEAHQLLPAYLKLTEAEENWLKNQKQAKH